MRDPCLYTPDLRLRPLAPADRAFYVALYGDADVMRWIGPPLAPAQAARAFDAACRHNAAARPGHRLWIAEARGTGEPVALVAMKRREAVGELGAMVVPAWWGRGVSRQAFRAIAAHAFDALGLHALEVRRPQDAQAVVVGRMLAAVGFAPPEPQADGTALWRLAPAGLVRG